MKLKSFNDRVLNIITCYCILYLINLPEVLKYTDAEILFKTNILIILDMFVISCLATFIPCVYYLNKEQKMDYKIGRRVCFYNSLIFLIVGLLSSVFMVNTYGYYYLVSTVLASIIFYFINLFLFVEYKSKESFVCNFISYIIVIATFLIVLFIGIKFVRSSIDPPNYRIDVENYYSSAR